MISIFSKSLYSCFTSISDSLVLKMRMTGFSKRARDCDFLFTKVLPQRCNITLTMITSPRWMRKQKSTRHSFFCWVTSSKINPTTCRILEAISKIGFWLKVKAGPSFNPQAYSRRSTPRRGLSVGPDPLTLILVAIADMDMLVRIEIALEGSNVIWFLAYRPLCVKTSEVKCYLLHLDKRVNFYCIENEFLFRFINFHKRSQHHNFAHSLIELLSL